MKTIFLAKDVENYSFVVLFGTQLGNSGSIAESVVETGRAAPYNWTTELYSLNQIKDIQELAKVRCPIVIITSTTGDGEPPENADRFWRQVHKKALPPTTLSQIKYTLLGLGDTNFNNFCNCGKQFNRRFLELSAQHFYSPAWADDAVGSDQVVEDWLEGLLPALEKLIDPFGEHSQKMDGNKNLTGTGSLALEGGGDSVPVASLKLPACPAVTLTLDYPPNLTIDDDCPDLSNPPAPYPLLGGPILTGSVLSAKYLTAQHSVKTTLEITLQVEESFDFEPGDAIGIICPNSFAEVELLLERLGVKQKADDCVQLALQSDALRGKYPPHLPKGKTTLRRILTHYSDIRATPKKAFLRLLAENTTDSVEKNALLLLSSREGSAAYEESVRAESLSILDILLKFSSCQPPVAAILENLPRLAPRAYSISSSPLSSATTFTVAFNLIEIDGARGHEGRQYSRNGICTAWLQEIVSDIVIPERGPASSGGLQCLPPNSENLNTKILFYKRKNHNFRLPADMKAPIIMVGPGTGVAPFIGFLQHRQLQKQNGEEIGHLFLYFGCRHSERDFLYQQTLENLKTDSVLTQLNVTFSRDKVDSDLKYVQDYMVLNKEQVVKILLDQEGYLYVCGDAKNMAKNVREKLTTCLQSVKGIPLKEAQEHIKTLVQSKRYLEDIWA